MFRDLQDDEDYAVNFTNQILDYVHQNAVVRDITYRPSLGKSRFTTDYESLLADPVFENIVMSKRNLTGGTLTEYDNVKAHIESVLVLIEEHASLQ